MIEEAPDFYENLKFQIKRKEEFLEHKQTTFRAEVKKCMESFEDVYYREAYKELLNELRDLALEEE